MADLVQLDYEGKSVGLTPMNLSKTTIARCFRVHEDGLHLKIVKNGKCENVWPRWNGKFLLPTGTKNAHVVAFPAEDQDLQEDDDDFSGNIWCSVRMHVLLCLRFIFFFNILFRYFIKKEIFLKRDLIAYARKF